MARSHIARTVNTAMVHAYWLIGREIVEVEQHGAGRAAYGEELLKKLAARLAQRFGKGFNLTGLKRMRQFYRAFPRGSALPAEFGGPEKGAAARPTAMPTSMAWSPHRIASGIEDRCAEPARRGHLHRSNVLLNRDLCPRAPRWQSPRRASSTRMTSAEKRPTRRSKRRRRSGTRS